MPSKRATAEETEADLEARIHAGIRVAFPWLPDGAIKHQIKFNFAFGRRILVVNAAKSQVEARLDILLEKDGKHLAVMELKRQSIKLTSDDEAQGLSYARLVQPPAPLVVVTNGTEVVILETHTGMPWKPMTTSESAFSALLTQASRVAGADIRHAIDTLMGTVPNVWMQAVRQVSADTIKDLTASWEEPALPFVADFLIPRGATQQLWKHLVAGERVLVLEGAPLSGKSNVLRELCLRTAQSENGAVLYVETGFGHGALQTVADALSRSLSWPVTPQQARDWLIRVSHQNGPRLIIAFDSLQPTDSTSIREIEDLSSIAFGPFLSLVLAMDEAVSQSFLTASNQRSSSPLGRRSKLISVGYLRDREFGIAQALMAQRHIHLMTGADMAAEYRDPWVLRAICSTAQAVLRSRPAIQALTLPSLLGLQLLQLVRDRFENAHELRRMFRGLARALIADVQGTARPYDLVLQQLEMGIIRRDAAKKELEPNDLQWLIDHGFVRRGMHEVAGATVLVRLPELLASEIAYVLADELSNRPRDDLYGTATWISGAASNLPLGEVVAAQAIIDAAKRPRGLPVGLISALVQMPPERELLDASGRYAMMLGNGAVVDFAFQTDGKGFAVIDGEQYEIDLGDDRSTLKNIHAWLILSHVAAVPFEAQGPDGPVRGDPDLLLQIGTCSVPLRGSRGPDFFRMLPATDMPGGVSTVHPGAGIIEPITLGILDYISVAEDQAENWISIAVSSGSIALISRLHTALGVLAGFQTHSRSKWAEAQLLTTVLPKLRQAVTDAENVAAPA